MMSGPPDVPELIVRQVHQVCVALPEAYEEDAWLGVRWRIRKRTFAHVLMVANGGPPVYATTIQKATGTAGPHCVVTFESEGPELARLRSAPPPYFAPQWRPTIVGLILGDDVDWAEVEELLTDSYCVQAPKRLAALVARHSKGPMP